MCFSCFSLFYNKFTEERLLIRKRFELSIVICNKFVDLKKNGCWIFSNSECRKKMFTI